MVDCVEDFHFARLKSLAKTNREIGLRSENPAVIALCRTLADLEEADDCVVTSYGLGAVLSLCLSQLKSGDHIIVAQGCFGAHGRAFADYMRSYGVFITTVLGTDFKSWCQAVTPMTRMAFMATHVKENVPEQAKYIRELAMLFRQTQNTNQQIQLVVEKNNRVFKRVRPMQHGADFVLYTSTAGFTAQASVVAGVICGRRPAMSSVAKSMQAAHVCVSPFIAWSLLRGLGADRNEVLDRILGVGSKDDSDRVAWLPTKGRDQHHEYSPQ